MFQGSVSMMKSRWLLTGGLAFGAGCLAVALWARPARDEAAKAEEPPKAAAPRIAAVTVYPNSALVTREVEAPAGQDLRELAVTPLPPPAAPRRLYSQNLHGSR